MTVAQLRPRLHALPTKSKQQKPLTVRRVRKCISVLLVLASVKLLIADTAQAVVIASYSPASQPTERTGPMRRVVMLRYTPLRFMGGCGIIVGPQSVLTAKHCLGRWPLSQLAIDMADAQQTRVKAKRISKHPDDKVDLAVIHLDQTVELKPVKFLDRNPQIADRVWLGGFGIYGAPGNPKSYGKFHAGFNVISTVHGGRATIVLDDLKDKSQLEALPARFDSGSPVWIETDQGWALSGVTVTATGSKAPDYGDRSSHQLVAPVRAWLDKVLGRNGE